MADELNILQLSLQLRLQLGPSDAVFVIIFLCKPDSLFYFWIVRISVFDLEYQKQGILKHGRNFVCFALRKKRNLYALVMH